MPARGSPNSHPPEFPENSRINPLQPARFLSEHRRFPLLEKFS